MKGNLLLSLLVALGPGALAVDINTTMGLLPRQASNLQVFSGALGGIQASAITQSGDTRRPFEVDGDTFNDFRSAAGRACDNQHNSCARMANDKTGQFTVGDCDAQNSDCKSAIGTATTTSFAALFSSNAEFDFFCDT